MTELAVTARPLAVIEAELDLLEQDTRQKEMTDLKITDYSGRGTSSASQQRQGRSTISPC